MIAKTNLDRKITDRELEVRGIDVRVARFRQAVDEMTQGRIIAAHKLPEEARRAEIAAIQEENASMKKAIMDEYYSAL